MSGATPCIPCGILPGEWREHRRDCPDHPYPEESIMTPTRKPNPLVRYQKAHAAADRARRGAARAHELAVKARKAQEAADMLSALLDDAEREEADALDALRVSLDELGVQDGAW